jgi:predicted amidohydrolase
VRRVFVTVFSSLARMFRVHLMAGSAMLADREGRVHNVAHLFGPDGRLIGTQAKCHLLPLERDWGLSTGHQFRVLDTATGRLAMPVWMDAAYFETFDILRRLGAEIALVGAANPEPYHPYRALRGLWPRVQESQMYGVQSALVGEAFGLTLSGPTAIYAPLDLSPGRDGVLAQAETVDRDEVVTADLDMAALRRLRQEDPQPKNMALIRYYLPDLYTRPWPWLEGVMPNG